MELINSLTRREKVYITLETVSVITILTVVYYLAFILTPAILK